MGGKVVPVQAEATVVDDSHATKRMSGEDIDEDVSNLTVMKTSLFFAGDGFAVYDADCQLVFRVDSYGGPDGHYRDELFLMDATGRCLLTLRRKRPSLHQRWEGYTGEGRDGSKPIFSVRRSSIIGRSSVTVETYNNTTATDPVSYSSSSEYLIEGSFSQRNCTFYELKPDERTVVAEIRRKVDTSTNVVLGKDVFVLSIITKKQPGASSIDATFAMGIVLVLDQISGDDGGSDDSGDDDGVVDLGEEVKTDSSSSSSSS